MRFLVVASRCHVYSPFKFESVLAKASLVKPSSLRVFACEEQGPHARKKSGADGEADIRDKVKLISLSP
jgi:hypothetical protein